MDTSPLQDKITALQLEILDDQRKIALLKDNVETNKKALKIYQRGLEKLKERDADS